MLRIPCPNCGVRDQDEFRCGGEAPIMRPAAPEHDRKGPHLERWLHTFGCKEWFLIRRDTLTHEITEVRRMSDVSGDG
jgi:sarcosine oxidase subunit delta